MVFRAMRKIEIEWGETKAAVSEEENLERKEKRLFLEMVIQVYGKCC